MIINKISVNNKVLIQLLPEEGKILTNGDIYSECVYLGANDSTDNWHSVTVEHDDIDI